MRANSILKPYSASILNISAMSYGALSKNAVLSLSRGAKLGNFAHNTGEGGISPFHLEGGADLVNPYGIIPVNPAKYPHVQYDMAMQFVDWLVSAKGQKLIGDYKLEGKQLFYPDAR